MSKAGPLVDITAAAHNSAGSTMPHKRPEKRPEKRPDTPTVDMKSGKDRKPLSQKSTNGNNANRTASPRFMSPTVASIRSKTTPASLKENSNSTTPTSASAGSSKGRSWMASAAKRVAFGKDSTGNTSRSGKEGQDAQPSGEKTTPTGSDKENTSPYSRLTPAEKAVLKDKPLPSPPVATVLTADGPVSSRTLLDASEAPLRRSPPIGEMATSSSEWPALSPKKVIAPERSQKTIRGTKSAEGIRERYPSQKGSLMTVSEDGSPFGSRKSQPNYDHNNTEMSPNERAFTRRTPDEKHTNFSFPRQTKTSSLRAKISASVVSSGGSSTSKNAGSTDNASVNDPKDRGRQLSNGPKGSKQPISRPSSAHARRSPSRPGVRFHGRAPAKMVAGSRRPSSRSSTRDKSSSGAANEESSAKESAPLIQQADPGEPNRIVALPEAQEGPETRRSSIPRLRSAPSSKTNVIDFAAGESHKSFRENQEPVSSEGLQDTAEQDHQDHPTSQTHVNDHPAGKDNDDASPTYRTRKFSNGHLELGPTLKISNEADSVIFGPSCPDRETAQFSKQAKKDKNVVKKNADLRRKVMTNELRKTQDIEQDQPSQDALRPKSLDPKLADGDKAEAEADKRPLKAKSADAETLKNLGEDIDPFVDAQARLNNHWVDMNPPILHSTTGSTPSEKEVCSGPEATLMTDNPGAEPVVETAHSPATSVATNVKGSSLGFEGQGPYKDASEATWKTVHQDYHKGRASYGRDETAKSPRQQQKSYHGRQHSGQTQRTATPPSKQKVSPFPPRDSRRTPVSDQAPIARVSPTVPQKDAGPARGSKDVPGIQHQLGASKAHESTQVNVEPADKKAGSRRRSSTVPGAKSMLSMSNLKGLFRRGATESKSAEPSSNKPTKAAGRVSLGASYPSKAEPAHGKGRATSSKAPAYGSTAHTQAKGGDEEVTKASATAMRILEAARNEVDTARKEHLLEIGKVMVDAITHAQEAEKAREEAKVAADKAEMSFMLTKKKVLDVAKFVDEWAAREGLRNGGSKRGGKA